MSAFVVLVARDLRLALRQGGDTAMVVAFFVLTVILFPFGVGPEPELLQRIAAGIVWVTALLAALLSLERLFQGDYEDGRERHGYPYTPIPGQVTRAHAGVPVSPPLVHCRPLPCRALGPYCRPSVRPQSCAGGAWTPNPHST